jgi:hypothetical protein
VLRCGATAFKMGGDVRRLTWDERREKSGENPYAVFSFRFLRWRIRALFSGIVLRRCAHRGLVGIFFSKYRFPQNRKIPTAASHRVFYKRYCA